MPGTSTDSTSIVVVPQTRDVGTQWDPSVLEANTSSIGTQTFEGKYSELYTVYLGMTFFVFLYQ